MHSNESTHFVILFIFWICTVLMLQKMINITGLISVVLFYLLILGVGIWAARKKQAGNDSEEEVMLAGRSIGLFVGIFTMTGESKLHTIPTDM